MAKSTASNAAKRDAMKIMAQLMGPMVPHLAEDLWSVLGGEGLVVNAAWPKADPALLVADSVTLPIQINGKKNAPRSPFLPEWTRQRLKSWCWRMKL